MKILEVCTASSPTYALVFNRALLLNQQHADLYTIDILCSAGEEVSLMRQQGMNVIISTLHRSLRPLALLRSLYNLHTILRRHEHHVIHLHFGVPSLVGRLLALFYRRPIWIYQSHGYSLSSNTSLLARVCYLALERLLKNTVDFALFQSQEDIELAQRHKLLRTEQIRFLGNGINTEKFCPTTQPTPHDDTSPFVFGMVARFEAIKNHQLLLDAIKYLRLQNPDANQPSFKVLLIGQGDLQEAIKALILAHELSPWVEIIPYSHDMPTFYQRIDMGLLTSFGEGLPRALLEPMACGKPVICSDVKGSREAVIDYETGFILPLGKPEIWAKKMHWCIQNRIALRSMGLAARERVVKHFAEHQVVERLGALYKNCHHLHTERQAASLMRSTT